MNAAFPPLFAPALYHYICGCSIPSMDISIDEVALEEARALLVKVKVYTIGLNTNFDALSHTCTCIALLQKCNFVNF